MQEDTLTSAADLSASFFKMFMSLGLIIALLLGTYYLLRKLIRIKLEKANADSSIRILEKRMLSPKTMLYLIELEGKQVLLAESQLEVRKLAD
jgi:flagellar biogenesis protein FliO